MSHRQRKSKTGIISRLIWLINIIFAVLLLSSYLSAYVNPGIITVFAFLGLAYPALLLINLLFFLFWLIRGKRKLLLSLVVVLIGYQPFIRHVQILPGREAPETGVMKMLSYNVQNMVHSNIGIEQAEIRKEIFTFIGSQQADIACIQEFSARGRDFEGVFEEMKDLTHYTYYYYENYNPKKTNRIDALVILSNYPAAATNTLSIPGAYHHFGIYADLINDEDTFRIYNLHLASIKLQHEDYQFVEDVSKGQTETGAFGEGSKSILRKLHSAFKNREKQTAVVVKSISECPYPVIICGDFNDTPLSFAYHKISAGLEDSFVDAGYGMGNTFAGNLPPLRIDFILHSSVFQSYDLRVHKIPLSDHYPVTVFLGRE